MFRNDTKIWCTTFVEVDGEENLCEITSTPGHKYYLPDNKKNRNINERHEHAGYADLSDKWGSAQNLRKGDRILLANGEYGIIDNIFVEKLDEPETTYNFEVADYHTYYVGQSGILTHNAGPCGPTTDPTTGEEVGTIYVDQNGNAMISPKGGGFTDGPKPGDIHTTYPNGSNYQRLNPNGHITNPTPHGHGHLIESGPNENIAGQGLSIDIFGNVVPFNSPAAHWPIKK